MKNDAHFLILSKKCVFFKKMLDKEIALLYNVITVEYWRCRSTQG